MFRIVVVALVVVGLTVGPINAAHAADPVTVAASGGSMLIESRTAAGAKVLTHYSMSGATVVGGPTRAGFTARHGALLSPKARLALSATKASSGVVGLALFTGEIAWMGYRQANPPPDWDWDTGDDPNLSSGTGFTSTAIVDTADTGSNWGPTRSRITACIYTENGNDYLYVGAEPIDLANCQYNGPYVDQPPDTGFSWAVGGSPLDAGLDVSEWETMLPIGNGSSAGWGSRKYFTADNSRYHVVHVENYTYPENSGVVLVDTEAPDSNRGRVVADVHCASDDPNASDSNLLNESDWYDDHDDRPLLPTVNCPTATHLAGADFYVEYEDGSKRYIIGGPADDPDRDGQSPVDALTGQPSTFFSFAPNPAPSYVPSADESLWDDCADPASGVGCTLTLYNVTEQRDASPTLDPGWWLEPDRDNRYECRLTHPTLGVLDLGLEECSAYVWVQDPEATDGYTTAAPAPTTVPNPAEGDDPEVPPVTLPATTPTGQPSTAPMPDQDCMNARQEEGGISSWIVFAGVACAFEWAYVPSPEFMAELQAARDGMANKPPMGYATAAADWFSAFGDLPDECLTIEAPVAGYGSYTVADSCGSHPVTDGIIGYRPFLLVAFYGAFLAPLAWWAWRTYAPGAGGST